MLGAILIYKDAILLALRSLRHLPKYISRRRYRRQRIRGEPSELTKSKRALRCAIHDVGDLHVPQLSNTLRLADQISTGGAQVRLRGPPRALVVRDRSCIWDARCPAGVRCHSAGAELRRPLFQELRSVAAAYGDPECRPGSRRPDSSPGTVGRRSLAQPRPLPYASVRHREEYPPILSTPRSASRRRESASGFSMRRDRPRHRSCQAKSDLLTEGLHLCSGVLRAPERKAPVASGARSSVWL